ncbi:glycoside hydrolase family 71 protein [Bradyrhizobium sp. Ai1a-2]|uniref:glycoside hydrolase family 71 protein n=1 Tax=Bradyrhizobium sp. Ai1a-2 TaxID=196490 RepID=UPI000414BF17|nr:glycoside hydrolase family 71 protein [Bradyrhizobium sp. Ai1a-2]
MPARWDKANAWLRTIACILSTTISSPSSANQHTDRLVFAHYMACCPFAGRNASIESLQHEMSLAARAGIDGFAINVGAWLKEPYYQNISSRLFQAAQQSGFKLFFSADAATGLSSAEVVDMVTRFWKESSYLKESGRPVLSTFGGSIEWYQQILDELKSRGISIFFVPNVRRPASPENIPGSLIETPDKATVQAILSDVPFADGLFYFGAAGKYHAISKSIEIGSDLTRSHSKLYMAPVTPYYRGLKQNFRVFEADGFVGMAEQWKAAIESKVDWIELVTWNDWAESSYVRPFEGEATIPLWNNHWGLLAAHDAYLSLSEYYIKWFKTGQMPKVAKSRIHVFYRPQSSTRCSLAPIGSCPRGFGDLRDLIHVVAEADKSVTIEIANGSAHQIFRGAPGLSFHKLALLPGPIRIIARSEDASAEWEAPIPYDSKEGELTTFNYLAVSLELKPGSQSRGSNEK